MRKCTEVGNQRFLEIGGAGILAPPEVLIAKTQRQLGTDKPSVFRNGPVVEVSFNLNRRIQDDDRLFWIVELPSRKPDKVFGMPGGHGTSSSHRR
jgi:hypothetical protein